MVRYRFDIPSYTEITTDVYALLIYLMMLIIVLMIFHSIFSTCRRYNSMYPLSSVR